MIPDLRAGRALRILLVEDEALIAMLAETQLVDAGHEVVASADTAADAIRLLDEVRPDLAVIDVQLADGSSGLEVAAVAHQRGIACLFATGNCPGKSREDAVGCLHKPYSETELLQAVAAVDAVVHGENPLVVPGEMHLYRHH